MLQYSRQVFSLQSFARCEWSSESILIKNALILIPSHVTPVPHSCDSLGYLTKNVLARPYILCEATQYPYPLNELIILSHTKRVLNERVVVSQAECGRSPSGHYIVSLKPKWNEPPLANSAWDEVRYYASNSVMCCFMYVSDVFDRFHLRSYVSTLYHCD